MVRTKELGVKTHLFILFFYKPVMSSKVIISSARPCKQSEIIITFAFTNHVLSNQFLRLLSWRLHFSEINPLILIWQQHKVKTFILSLPQPTLPPALLSEKVTDVWGPFVLHCICESIQGCHLFGLVSVV